MYITKANDYVVDFIIKRINKLEKQNNKNKIIISIDGESGCGKTSISKRIEEKMENKVVSVNADHYMKSSKEIIDFYSKNKQTPNLIYENGWYYKKDLDDLFVNFLENNNYSYTSMRFKNKKKEINLNLDKKILVIDGCFISHPENSKDYIDMSVFISLPKKDIKDRRERRRVAKGLKKGGSKVSYVFDESFDFYVNRYKAPEKNDFNIILSLQ
jgi:uridine kinase